MYGISEYAACNRMGYYKKVIDRSTANGNGRVQLRTKRNA